MPPKAPKALAKKSPSAGAAAPSWDAGLTKAPFEEVTSGSLWLTLAVRSKQLLFRCKLALAR